MLEILSIFLFLCPPFNGYEVADIGRNQYLADFFAVKPFLSGTEYELLSFREKELFVECGQIAGLNPTHNNLGRYDIGDLVATERKRLSLKEAQSSHIFSLIGKLAELSKVAPEELPSPGGLGSLNSNGIMEVRIRKESQKVSYVTSVEAVAKEHNSTLKAIKALFSATRKFAIPLCGRNKFGTIK